MRLVLETKIKGVQTCYARNMTGTISFDGILNGDFLAIVSGGIAWSNIIAQKHRHVHFGLNNGLELYTAINDAFEMSENDRHVRQEQMCYNQHRIDERATEQRYLDLRSSAWKDKALTEVNCDINCTSSITFGRLAPH
jgi:hypothetical protein